VRRLLIAFLLVVLFLDTVFMAAITPLLPQYTDQLGISKSEAGILTGSYAAGTMLASLPLGWLAGRWGVRPTLVLGLLLMSVTSLVFGFGDSYGVLLVARFVQGIGGAACWAGGLGWLIESSPRERRGELIGYGISAAVAGVVFGPVFGAAAHAFGPEAVFGAIGVLAGGLFAAGLRFTAPPVQPTSLRVLVPAFRDPAVLSAMWLVTLPSLMLGAINVLAPLRLDEFGAGATVIAAAFLAAGVIEGIINPVMGRVCDRRGPRSPLTVALAVSALVMLMLCLPGSAVALVAIVALGAPLVGMASTPAWAHLSEAADRYRIPQGLGFAFTNLGWSTGQAAGTAGSGQLAEMAGHAAPYLVLAAATAVTVSVLAGRGRSADAVALARSAPGEVSEHGSEHSRT
jgi:predicted MFS family arabinose efflux permease